MSSGWLPRGILFLELFSGIGAAAGGAALAGDPSGDLLRMPLWLLRDSPFQSFLVPGLVLLLAVGGSNLAGAWLVWRAHPHGRVVSLAAGVVLAGWILAEIAFIGYVHWAQALYLAIGALTAVLAALWTPALRKLELGSARPRG